MNKKIELEVMKAYSDCTDKNFERAIKTRNLDFKASEPVMRDEAIRIMKKAIPGGYNLFEADILKAIPADREIVIAREGSPCVYVKGDELSASVGHSMTCDELTFDFNETRIWWD